MVAQVIPPLDETWIGEEIKVTLLLPDNIRHGTVVTVRAMADTHRSETCETAFPVIILDRPEGEVFPDQYPHAFPDRPAGARFGKCGLKSLIPTAPPCCGTFSLGGALVAVPEGFACPEDRGIPFQLTFGGSDQGGITGRAEIVSVHKIPGKGGIGLGLRFISLSNRDSRKLQRVINRLPGLLRDRETLEEAGGSDGSATEV